MRYTTGYEKKATATNEPLSVDNETLMETLKRFPIVTVFSAHHRPFCFPNPFSFYYFPLPKRCAAQKNGQ